MVGDMAIILFSASAPSATHPSLIERSKKKIDQASMFLIHRQQLDLRIITCLPLACFLPQIFEMFVARGGGGGEPL